MEYSTYQKLFSSETKTRSAGYLELADRLKSLPDWLNHEFEDWLLPIESFIQEADPEAKHNGLVATLRLVENYSHSARIAKKVSKYIVDNCFQQDNQIKSVALDILRAFFKAGAESSIQEAMVTGLGHRDSKVVLGCLESLRLLTREFGLSKIETSQLWLILNKLLEDRDPAVRATARHYSFVVRDEKGSAFEDVLDRLTSKEKIQDLKELWACLSIERNCCQS